MEAWLAEMEMEVDQAPNFIDNPCYQYESVNAATFAEQLSATISEHFPYPYSSESNVFIDHFTPPIETSNNNNDNNNNNNRDEYFGESQQNKNDKEMNNRMKQSVRAGEKRKRHPNQVQDHIIAERRRRELLSQLFISLSGLVPGLKKMDKTSVLGEAIKYMKQLQEKVKTLEEQVAKRAVESMVVIKKSQVEVSDESGDYYVVDDKSTSYSFGGNGGGGCGSSSEADVVHDSLPEIEVKVSSNKLLIKICCENQKGIMTKLFGLFEKHDLNISNCSVVSFESLTLDITIVAQMERDSNVNVRSFVKNVRSAILLSSRR